MVERHLFPPCEPSERPGRPARSLWRPSTLPARRSRAGWARHSRRPRPTAPTSIQSSSGFLPEPGTLGALAFATACRRAGLAVRYLGADLPAEEWGAGGPRYRRQNGRDRRAHRCRCRRGPRRGGGPATRISEIARGVRRMGRRRHPGRDCPPRRAHRRRGGHSLELTNTPLPLTPGSGEQTLSVGPTSDAGVAPFVDRSWPSNAFRRDIPCPRTRSAAGLW